MRKWKFSLSANLSAVNVLKNSIKFINDWSIKTRRVYNMENCKEEQAYNFGVANLFQIC